MSEGMKVKRTVAEIQTDYQNLCLKAGHVQYQIYNYKRDLALINDELRDLNLEAAAVSAELEKAKAAAKVEDKTPEPLVESKPALEAQQ